MFADFHANRHTFITNLSKAEVPLTVAERLARHSTVALTANRYTHLGINDQVAGIEALPRPPGANDHQNTVGVMRATGTDDRYPPVASDSPSNARNGTFRVPSLPPTCQAMRPATHGDAQIILETVEKPGPVKGLPIRRKVLN